MSYAVARSASRLHRGLILSISVFAFVLAVWLPSTSDAASYALQPAAQVDVTVLETPNTTLSTATVGLEAASTITVDDATMNILALSFILTPGSELTLSQPFGGYDEILLSSVSVATTGASEIDRQSVGTVYTFVATNVEVQATYSATDSTSSNSPTGSQAISFLTNFNGVYDANANTVSLFGVQLGVVPGAAFSEPESLIIQANFNVVGGAETLVPEPSTGVLLSMGLLGLARMGSRARSNGRPGRD